MLNASRDSLSQLSLNFENYKSLRDKDVLQLQSERNKAEAQLAIERGWKIALLILASRLAAKEGYDLGHSWHWW